MNTQRTYTLTFIDPQQRLLVLKGIRENVRNVCIASHKLLGRRCIGLRLEV